MQQFCAENWGSDKTLARFLLGRAAAASLDPTGKTAAPSAIDKGI